MTERIEPPREPEVRAWHHCVVLLVACLLIISRRPAAVFHPQFWSEDGGIFFADAYNLGGWAALFRTYAGYFHIVPRIGAALAQLAPMARAPLVMNLIAILVQATPVNLLLRSRSSAWGGLYFRALMAVAYLALPNNAEITLGITYSNWVLALCMILVVVAAAPKGWIGQAFDCFLLVLAGLSGPFCIFALPIAIFLLGERRERWKWVTCGVVAACVVTQLWALLILDPKGRPASPIGFSTALFTRMLGGNVFADALLGRIPLSAIQGTGVFLFLLCVALGGVAIMAACFLKANLEMRLFLLFAALVFAASLLSPAVYPQGGTTRWEVMAGIVGIRYWFMPSLAFVWTLLWCARNGTALLKSIAGMLLCLMVFGVVMDWKNPAVKEIHFAEFVKAFEAAPAGTVMILHENQDWTMRLVKHASR
jgi:hypothetical protein